MQHSGQPALGGPAPNCSPTRTAFLPGFDQRVRHFVIGKLGEAAVVVTQGMETWRLAEAHDLIRFLGELGQCVGRRDRDRHDDRAGRPPLRARIATFMVVPVATPSSTMIAVFPVIDRGGRSPR